MKFAVKHGRARAGTLQLGSFEIETPSLLLCTRKGLPLFISPDLRPSLPAPYFRFLQFSPLHFLDGITPKKISKIGGLHQMLGLPDYGLVAVPRDSIQCLPSHDATDKTGASFETPCGRRLDFSGKTLPPVVEGCSCYTCRNHTKAYINHLLNVHEMLARTLLELHNTHHYLSFFRLIRESIKEGKFERFRQRFIADRREHLAVSAV